ncbi:unnamed protein product [Rotaria socialis]
MNNNQSLNNTENISLATTEMSLLRNARFWILLLFDIPSVACAFFVLFCIFIDRKLRSNVKNHVLVIILLLGIGSQLIDVPFYLNFLVQSSVVPAKPSICLLWWFVNIGMYDGGVLFMAWTAFERHIIVFHEQWISTKQTNTSSTATTNTTIYGQGQTGKFHFTDNHATLNGALWNY